MPASVELSDDVASRLVPASPSPAADPAAEAARWYAARDYRRAADAAALALTNGTDDVAIWMVLVNSLINCGEIEASERACLRGRERHGMCAELAVLHAFVLLEGWPAS